eukprot:scaffold2334_cov159-Pinguiococcus_pyrenoidosus.AAC.1
MQIVSTRLKGGRSVSGLKGHHETSRGTGSKTSFEALALGRQLRVGFWPAVLTYWRTGAPR